MKSFIGLTLVSLTFWACNNPQQEEASLELNAPPIQGTWQLITGITIQNNDSTITNYSFGKSFIKVINASHFAFMGHDLNKGKDSTAFYTSGGGTYELKDSAYTEHLQYCSDRAWEGNDFNFTISINKDTLIQQGLEKIDSIGVNRINIEKYIRVKK